MRINVFKSGGNSAEGGFVSNGLTLQGPLILSGPHTDHLHAVPKQYVDNATYNLDANNITSGVLAAARLPAFTGDATTILGTSNLILANTGVTPGSIIKPTVDAKGRVVSGGTITEADITAISFDKVTTGRPTTLNGYGITDGVPLSGNISITGDFIQSADPVTNNQIATKHYVDTAAGVAGGISVGDIIRKPYTTTPAGFLKCNGGEVDKTIYANLYSVIGDTFALLTDNSGGQPWSNQYQINELQSSELISWTAGTAGSAYAHRTVFVTKNRVYLVGGYNGSATISTVETAPINSDGTLGSWSTGTALPAILHGTSAIVTKNKVYLIGGYSASGASSTVYMASINADGTIGTWSTGTALPSVLTYTRAVLIKNKIYTICGRNSSSNISTIYTCTLNDDGSMNAWSVYGSYPLSCSSCQVSIIRNKLYVIGGHNGTSSINNVYYADINNDGTLGSWISAPGIPVALNSASFYVTKAKVYLIGGTTTTNIADIYSASVNNDGTLGSWTKSATLPAALTNSCIFATSGKLYICSGYNVSGTSVNTLYSASISGGSNDYSSYYSQTSDTTVNYLMPGSGKPWQQQYQINTTQTGDITGWTTGTSLPGVLSYSQAIVTKNRVYLLGGNASSVVYTAPINTDGTLGTWTTGTSIPGPLALSQAIVTKNRVYLLGGISSSTVYTAPINSDGTLGTWATGTALPAAVSASQAIITKDRVYILGGASTTIYTAPINSDGTLGTWATSGSIPSAVSYSHAVVTKNKVYLLGGYNGSSVVSTVYKASINSNGTLGTWSTGTSLPIAIDQAQTFTSSNYVYIIGGQDNSGSNALSTVYMAPILADGSIGTWVLGTSLPAGFCVSNLIVTNSRIYLLGGYNGGFVATVYTAPIPGGLNDYTSYYDGTIQPVSTISTKFKLPDYSILDKEFGEVVTSYIKY